jgi:LysM repeat protein
VPLLVAAIATAAAPGWSLYRIKSGDTLEAIAKRYHTSVARLVAANNLPGNGNLIIAGALLRVPVPSAPRATATRTVVVTYRHRVVSGDSVIKIARIYHVAPSVVVTANHLRSSRIVRLGSVLTIPVRRTVKVATRASTSANSFAGRTYPSGIVGAAAHNRAVLASRPKPSMAYVKRLIIRTAKANHVDPALALAISYQESGFNQRAVSVANAIGAMQVIPSTGDWASDVVGRRLDLLDVRDNVLAGVVLLRVLGKNAPNRATAVAGYYQGLASVQRDGMYADTASYVRNVLALRGRFA